MSLHTIARADHRMADLVNNGIGLADLCGPAAGARYLRDHGVPMAIALRVLTRPDQRRHYG